MIGLVALCATATSSYAATVDSVQGTAKFSQGDGFAPLDVGTVLNVGDRVVVATGGAVSITLNDGCAFTVLAGRTFTVPAAAGCAAVVAPATAPGMPAIAVPAIIAGIAAIVVISNDDPVSP
jgi:hypothetical protein